MNVRTEPEVSFASSARISERARRVHPGGINSLNYKLAPGVVFVDRADGVEVVDVDGNCFVDFWCGHSALLLGHNHPAVRDAIVAQAQRGTNFGLATEVQVELAEAIQDRFPSMERLHVSDSASRATAFAVRIARAFTGRQKVAKFNGAYHGTGDTLFFGLAGYHAAGSGPTRLGEPPAARPGVSRRAAEDVVLLDWNSFEQTQAAVDAFGAELAAIIAEPVVGEGIVPPADGFLAQLRRLCDERGILLIFDETITGGMSRGGAQGLYGVMPDLTCLGKMIGGGMPIAAVGGRADVMAVTDGSEAPPPVLLATTFPGHPIACAAGVAQLAHLDARAYARMHELTERLRGGVETIAAARGVPLRATTAAHLFHLHWNERPIETHDDHAACTPEPLRAITRSLFEDGLYIELAARGCVTAAHEERHVDALVAGIDRAVAAWSAEAAG